jgi:NADH:ubiquinone oxidoreductase subunit 6 (subunit J)
VNLAEGVQIVSFGILAVMMIGTALGVVLLPKIVHSAFLLAGVFIYSAECGFCGCCSNLGLCGCS